MWKLRHVKVLLASLVLAVFCTGLVHSREATEAAQATTVQVAELPRQAQETYRLIPSGGPFPYDKDGTVFGNRERQLPAQPRGYYREYTVTTPGERNRGTRRIVCGGPAKAPEVCFYTADHYASFRKIVP